MSTASGLSAREHSEMRDLVLAGTQRIRPASAARTQFVAIGVSLVLVGAVIGGTFTAVLTSDNEPLPAVTNTPTPGPLPVTNPGEWVAYSSGFGEGDIYFVKPGAAPHRVIGADDDDLDQICPAFSEDGSRLAFGQATGNDQSGWEDPAVVISDLTPTGEPAGSRVIPLDGRAFPPCPIWSPDGRWLAFGAGSTPGRTWGTATGVWLVGVETGEIRRLTDLTVTDIEWARDGSQLFIADADGILVYSIADDDTRVISDSVGAVGLTASPQGDTLAVERRWNNDPIAERYDLWLMSTEGTDRRILIEDYTHERGIGPVWSPDGSRIVLQRTGDTTIAHPPGQYPILGENDSVVVVTVGENDPLGPIGTQTVIATRTTEGSETRRWFPVTVSWGPDSATLRLVGGELLASGDMAAGSGLLTVPVDGTVAPTILWETPEGIGSMSIFPPNDFQTWSAP